MTSSPSFLLGALVTTIASAALLGAQRPDSSRMVRFDAAIGVSMNSPADVNQRPKCDQLGLPCTSPKTLPDGGLLLQAAVEGIPHVAIVAEASTYVNGWDTTGVDRALTNHVSALLAGARLVTDTRILAWHKDSTRYRAFVQALVGPEASTVLPTRFAIQPGAGFDGKVGWPPAWVRIEYDYRWTRGSPRNLSGGRFAAALVVSGPDR